MHVNKYRTHVTNGPVFNPSSLFIMRSGFVRFVTVSIFVDVGRKFDDSLAVVKKSRFFHNNCVATELIFKLAARVP